MPLALCACYTSFELDDGGHRVDAGSPISDAGYRSDAPPPPTFCYDHAQVVDAPSDGLCRDFEITSDARYASCNRESDRTFRAFRLAHPATIRSAYVTVHCGDASCYGEVDLPYTDAGDCVSCGAAWTIDPRFGGSQVDLMPALADAMDGPDRDPEYTVGRARDAHGDPSFTVTVCTIDAR